jgi:hypothetical protein
MEKINKGLENLVGDLEIAGKAMAIFSQSAAKSRLILSECSNRPIREEEKETLEAMTARYSRALDFFLQKLLRTIDQVELSDEGSLLDRVNRFKKREVLQDEVDWADLKNLRNQIAHEYIIDKADKVVRDALQWEPILIQAFNNAKTYCKKFGI